MNLFNASLLATALAAVAVVPAQAAETASFQVELTVPASCDITASQNVDFGDVRADAAPAEGTGAVVVECTKDTAYQVQLDDGLNTGRRMQGVTAATEYVDYELYLDANRTTVWNTTNRVPGAGTGYGTGVAFEHAHTVYARATLTGAEPAGTYRDTVTATVTF